MRYAVMFSTRTTHSQVHAMTCRVLPLGKRNGCVITRIDAATPDEAAALFAEQEDLAARGLPAVEVCPCAIR